LPGNPNIAPEPSRQEDEMARKILIVDNEVQMVRLLASRLKDSGYEVATACDSQQCVKMALEERPDLIILDLIMPEGGGIYAFKRLKRSAKTAAIPVIFITAYLSEHVLGKVTRMGAKAFIPKPDDTADLLWKVRKALGEEPASLRKERSRRRTNLDRKPRSKKEEKARKILVADDDPRFVELLSSRLRANDYEVVTAYDGQQCVRIAREERPDLVVLDVLMPEGGGFYALRRLRESAKTAAIPVIVITGYPTEHVEDSVLEMGAEVLIPKPIDSSNLLWKVRRALGEEPEKGPASLD
jgi:two-component system cell cycle response regulator